MPRDIPVSNGNLLLNFDANYRIRDIYFPWIGLENHTLGNEFRFGIWVDGRISWMGPEWEKDLRYRDDTLVTQVTLRNSALALELRCQDTVDCHLDVYVRRIEVIDLEGRARDVKLFFNQDFHLYGNEIGETAYYDPRTKSVIHYERNRYFLVNCCNSEAPVADYFSCGVKERPGKQPSWKEAEGGELGGNPVSWGRAESTVGVRVHVPAGGSGTAFYWLAAGQCYEEVVHINAVVSEKSPFELIRRTSDYWRAWVRKEPRSFGDLPNSVAQIFNRSLLILRTQIDNRGAIIAANDSDIMRFGGDTYSYMWGRDGAFVAAALEKAGYSELCRKFFEFCRRALSEEGYLFQHYNPDGSLASNWHAWLLDGKEVLPIQEDSTALILWALWLHYEYTRDVEFIRPLYETLILKAADFLVAHRDPDTRLPIPSYDLWEERYGVHSFTVAAVIAGLRGAANFARVFQDASRAETYDTVADQMAAGVVKHLFHAGHQRYARSGYRNESGYELDEVIDVSLLGLATLGALPLDDPRIVATVEAVRRQLTLETRIGGLARYQNDRYQREDDVPESVPGNPWFISILWLGEYLVARAGSVEELHEALPCLEWCAKNALPSGVLAEQVHPVKGYPLSVSPLTWSHSAYVWVVLQYVEKFDALTKDAAEVPPPRSLREKRSTAPSSLCSHESAGRCEIASTRDRSIRLGDSLGLIALGRNAGFSLAEIGAMFAPDGRPRIDRAQLAAKAEELDRTIRKLVALRDGLRHAAECPAPSHMECPTFRRMTEMESMPCSTGKRANSGWSLGAWPQIPVRVPLCCAAASRSAIVPVTAS